MKLLFSVPTGYHLRELILPLKSLLESDSEVDSVLIITPAAKFQSELFPSFSDTFQFIENPKTLEETKALLQSQGPDVVVTNTVGHDELDYPLLKAASELDIKTLTFIASWDNVWKIDRLLKANRPVHVADHIIVWNEMMAKHFKQIFTDVSQDRISVIGAPRLDYFWKTENVPSKQDLYTYLGISDTSKPLIHFPTTELYPMDYIVEAVSSAMKGNTLPQAHLYASVHPGGNLDNHAELKKFGAQVRYSFGRRDTAPHPSFQYVPTQEEIYMLVALFTHADVLINHSSTTAIESFAGHTPVINVKYGKPLDWWRWKRSMVYRDFGEHYRDVLADQATFVVTSKAELIESTKQALEQPSVKEDAQAKTLSRMITTTDGTASEKVLAAIKKMVV